MSHVLADERRKMSGESNEENPGSAQAHGTLPHFIFGIACLSACKCITDHNDPSA